MGRKQSPKLEKNLIRSISTFKIPHPHSHGPSLSFTRQILLIVPFVRSVMLDGKELTEHRRQRFTSWHRGLQQGASDLSWEAQEGFPEEAVPPRWSLKAKRKFKVWGC